MRYTRKIVITCKRERARRLHTRSPQGLAEPAGSDPGVLVVNGGDIRRVPALMLAGGEEG